MTERPTTLMMLVAHKDRYAFDERAYQERRRQYAASLATSKAALATYRTKYRVGQVAA